VRVRTPCSRTRARPAAASPLQPGIDGFAFHRQNAESALVHAVERLAGDESLEALDAEGKLPRRERPLRAQTAVAESLQVLGCRVLGAVDDPQLLAAAALHRGLDDAALSSCD